LIRKAVSVALIVALLLLTLPMKISGQAQAAQVEDPLDAAIAPHLSRVVYALSEPSYSTSCDIRGYFKASVGSPLISNSDSRLVVSATSTIKSSVILSQTDVPEINQTRAYYEMCFNITNTLAWVNTSLYDLSTAWVNVSVHAGAFYYDYLVQGGSRSLGVLYSPAAAEVDYVIGFDLATTSVTLFVYSSTGTLLADKYISDNALVGGELDELRFELQGASSSTICLDYLYVAGSISQATSSSSGLRLSSILPEVEETVARLDLDPTSLTLDNSLRSELFGFEGPDLERRMTERELISAIGTTGIHQQRAAGRLIAEGYKDLRYSIEDSLVAYIAIEEGVEYDDVFLIDYYIDYLQCKIKIDSRIADELADTFDATGSEVIEALGGTLEEDAVTPSIYYTDPVVATPNSSFLVGMVTLAPIVSSDLLRGLFSDPFGTRRAYDYATDAYNDALATASDSYNRTIALVKEWQESTEEKYQQIRQDFLNYMSISQAQISQLSSDYSESLDKFERSMSSFYAYTSNQFEATNAIIAKLLLQNELYANSSQMLNQYFAGQMARTNEVVMNLTSALTSSLSTTSFWSGVLNDGKAESEPLTFSGFFGNNVQTWTIVIVVIFVTIIVALVLISVIKPGKGKHNKKS